MELHSSSSSSSSEEDADKAEEEPKAEDDSKAEETQPLDPSLETSSGSLPVGRDMRRLKSATLDRMGKMLKINSKLNGEKSDVINVSMSQDDATRKQKFNSLTRMFRFTDKEQKSESLGQRGRSFAKFLRRKIPNEGDIPQGKPDEHIRGIFSRILGQIRGRTSKHNSSAENFSQNNKEKQMLSTSLPIESTISNSDMKISDAEIKAFH